MTAKEVERKLSRMYWLKKEVKAKERKRKELLTQATHITADFSPTPSGGDPMSKPERYAMETYDLLHDLDESYRILLQAQKECMELIELLDDPLLRAILIDYHFNGIKLSDIEIIYHYSRSQIWNLRQKAYQQIEDKTQLDMT